MARRSLKPQLNQIRAWVREGRTNAWIAHQLEVTAKDIDAFKREHGLVEGANGDADSAPATIEDELDLRAEDDALVAAELDAEPDEDEDDEADEPSSDEDGEGAGRKRRRRGRRGGRGRGRGRGRRAALEGTFDHGEEGYGLWLDPAIQEDPVYAEHWAGHRPVRIVVETDRIVIRRAGEDEGDSGESDDNS
jgi:hypothetical protein